jgi:hypothetical protein
VAEKWQVSAKVLIAPAEEATTPEFTTRRLYPRRRTDPPEREVRVDGKVTGRARQKKLPTASAVFYEATGVLPFNGQHVPLQLNTDFDERCRTVARSALDPWAFEQHWTWRYRDVARGDPRANVGGER